MGAFSQAVESAVRVTERSPGDASAWARLGRLRLRIRDYPGALAALEQARLIEPTVEALLDLALAHNLAGDVGAEVVAAEQATLVDPQSRAAWSRYAHALARTERVTETIAACERALSLRDDPEVRDLLAQVRRAVPRELDAA